MTNDKKYSSFLDTGKEKDVAGGPPEDPTKNVIALTEAAVLRINDIAAVREQLTDEKIRRVNDALLFHDKLATLRAEHNKELRLAESDRVDKIRSVDVANAAATATQLLSAVTTLATTAQATAETLRNQVAATAAAVAGQTERVVNPILERVALLEKSSYTGAGKAVPADAQMAELVSVVSKLTSAGSMSSGKQEGFSASWGIILGLVAMLGVLISMGAFIYTFTRSNAPTPPQVIYATPPTASTVK